MVDGGDILNVLAFTPSIDFLGYFDTLYLSKKSDFFKNLEYCGI